jgi:hypothetical protein
VPKTTFYCLEQFPLLSQQYLSPSLVKHFCAEAGEEEMIIKVERRRNAMLGIEFLWDHFFVVNICCHMTMFFYAKG